MIANKTESRNFNATSTIDNTIVMYMSVSYSSNGDFSTNNSIRKDAMDLYKAHKEEVDKDYADFCDEIYQEIFG